MERGKNVRVRWGREMGLIFFALASTLMRPKGTLQLRPTQANLTTLFSFNNSQETCHNDGGHHNFL